MAGILAAGGRLRKKTRHPADRRACTFDVEGTAGGGYDGWMDSYGNQLRAGGGDRAWVSAMSAGEAAGTEAALASLPKDAASAGAALPLAIAAWNLVDPALAARLLEEWLATADAVGDPSPACPVAAQLAEEVASRLPDPETFVTRLLPALAKNVVRNFDRYDPQGLGLPVWPSAEAALFPREYAPGRFTVDLAVLLSNEAAALGRLAKGHAELDRELGEAEATKRELDMWVLEEFWDPETSTFLRHDEGADSVPDRSPCGWFPLVWEESTAEMCEVLRMQAADVDPAAWPARAWVLTFALLLRTAHASAIGRMRRQGIPAGATPAEEAAWKVLSAGAEAARRTALADVPRAVRWMDVHGRGIARGALLAGAVLVVGLLAKGCFPREGSGAETDLERRARLACEKGDHSRAATLYGQAARRGQGVYFLYRQAGEWMHLEQFAAAEAAYRDVLRRAPATPNARLNLALAVLRQGRREEALELYRAFSAESDAAAHPELTARAQLAAELLERQLALDREEPGTPPSGER